MSGNHGGTYGGMGERKVALDSPLFNAPFRPAGWKCKKYAGNSGTKLNIHTGLRMYAL
jgi:hypothetical protein